jgi:hypothetical protein
MGGGLLKMPPLLAWSRGVSRRRSPFLSLTKLLPTQEIQALIKVLINQLINQEFFKHGLFFKLKQFENSQFFQ